MQVGGGPTGVELAAEIHDLIEEDMLTYFPRLKVCNTPPPTAAFGFSIVKSGKHLTGGISLARHWSGGPNREWLQIRVVTVDAGMVPAEQLCQRPVLSESSA